jgi:hypothetical protein
MWQRSSGEQRNDDSCVVQFCDLIKSGTFRIPNTNDDFGTNCIDSIQRKLHRLPRREEKRKIH